MFNLFKWFQRKIVPQPEEVLVTLAFLKNGKAHVERLTQILNDRAEPFQQLTSYNWVGVAGLIRVEDDVFGYEVKIGHHISMLDCNPHVYGLTHDEMKPLFDAILSCTPGSVPYEKKMLRLRYPNCQHPTIMQETDWGAFYKRTVTKCAQCGTILETGEWGE